MTAISGQADLVVPKTVFHAVIKSRIRHDVESLRRSGSLSQEEAARLTPQSLDTIADAAYPTYLQSSGLLRFFRADGDDYRFQLTVQRGLVTINGRPVNPMAMTHRQ